MSGSGFGVVVFGGADDFFDSVFGDEVSAGGASFDAEFGEVERADEVAHAEFRLEVDEEHLGGAFLVGFVDGEVEDSGAGFAFGEEVFLVAGDAADGEAFGEDGSVATVAVDHGVDEVLIFAEEGDAHGFLADEDFFGDADDADFAVLGEGDDVVEG